MTRIVVDPKNGTADLSLEALRVALREDLEARALSRWMRVLRSDRRAGARALGEICAKRLERKQRDRARVRRLFRRRNSLLDQGISFVAGVDEVGMGPLAGPVVAAAVVLPRRVDLPGLNDSKKLSVAARERLASSIRQQAVGFSVAEVDPAEIDRLNIYHAGLEAMRRAVVALEPEPGHILVDARTVPRVRQAQTPLVGGDAIDGSIAAASILAKVHRDGLMCDFDTRFPGYGLARHMGYPTPQHLLALRRLGPSPIHRRSFAPVSEALEAKGTPV